jgi:hypothetical protein
MQYTVGKHFSQFEHCLQAKAYVHAVSLDCAKQYALMCTTAANVLKVKNKIFVVLSGAKKLEDASQM